MKRTQVRRTVKYDINTGIFYSCDTEQPVGKIDHNDGYVYLWIDGNKYRADKTAWFLVTGYWPEDDIEHLNGVKHDNWLSNLKELKLKKIRKDNKTKITGVYRDKEKHLWRSQITHEYVRTDLGSHETLDNAVVARCKAELKIGIVDSPAQDYVNKMFL